MVSERPGGAPGGSGERKCAYIGGRSPICSTIKTGLEDARGRYAQCLNNIHSSCAVVGSSKHLLSADFGEEIDGHEVVIRINSAMAGNGTDELTKFVGSRTNFRFVNGLGLDPASDKDTSICTFIHEIDVSRKCGALCWRDPSSCSSKCTWKEADIRCGYRSNPEKEPDGENTVILDHLHAAVAEMLIMLPRKSRMESIITAGFKALAFALRACERVTIYGFGPSCDGKMGERYYQSTKLHLGHAYADEMNLLLNISGQNPAEALVPYSRALGPDKHFFGVPNGTMREDEVRKWVRASRVDMRLPQCLRNMSKHAASVVRDVWLPIPLTVIEP